MTLPFKKERKGDINSLCHFDAVFPFSSGTAVLVTAGVLKKNGVNYILVVVTI